MTLKSYYQNLGEPVAPKTLFVQKIANRCEVNQQTVRLWIQGKSKPSMEKHVDILSEETGIPKENLFV